MFDKIVRRFRRYRARAKFAPSIAVTSLNGLVKLGSRYGGWTFEPAPDLYGATLISCGLGEDASFDIALASLFSAKIVIVDPTPRAISHFVAIQENLGQPALRGYAKGGQQPITAYDLRGIGPQTLCLEPCALWKESGPLKFFAPPTPAHVSHSISNFQNGYSRQTPFIEVPAITPMALLEKYGLSAPPLMKLDIEGAEVEVIRCMMENAIRPRQVLVEFDEMNAPSALSKTRAEETDALLRQSGYACRFFDGQANFLYTRTSGL